MSAPTPDRWVGASDHATGLAPAGDQGCQVARAGRAAGRELRLAAAERQARGADVFPTVAGVNGCLPLAG